jgi:hypothetical protein
VFCLLESDDCEKALTICNHALKCYPDDPIMLMYKSDALLSMEQPTSTECFDSLDHLIQVLEQKRERLTNYEQTMLAQAHNNRAQLFICMGQKSNAMVELTIALRKAHTSMEGADPDTVLCISFNLTLLHLQKDQVEDAATIWFKQRHIPMDHEKEYYLMLYNRLQQEERKDAPVVSHVCGVCSTDQQRLMDLEMLHRWYKYLESGKSTAAGVIEHILSDPQ